VDAEYGEVYRELFEKHWWWRSRSELIVDKLRQLQPAGGWKQILDVGCGDGLFFDRLAEFGEIEGVEPSSELVHPSNPHRNRIYVGPFDDSFRPGKKYSLILMLDVLEHLQDPVGALRHALELLAPEGTVIVTVPAFMALWTNHDVLNHHLTRYTKGSFREVAREASLDIEEARYFYHWTFPAKLATRVVEQVFRAKPEAPRIPAMWLNQALFWLSRVEQKTLSTLTVPFGSSLMIVGRQGKSA
jgi:2-polyprenyl-3-methyl-5-hydroxy-6-metoxy-1,4-benzoquinol methylase